jgi:hypothetical protein
MSEHASHHASHPAEDKPDSPAPTDVVEPPDPGPPPQDLSLVNAPGQDFSETIILNRGLVVESTNPADIVPNTPQIRPAGATPAPPSPTEPAPEPLPAPEPPPADA